jgi:hypothetical protein
MRCEAAPPSRRALGLDGQGSSTGSRPRLSLPRRAATYPTATFALSTPLTVSASALEGKVAHLSVTGTFDIHGTSKKETSIGGFVNVTERATMEFDLRLQRS